MHLALWLPNYHATGSVIPHLYLTAEGLLSHVQVGIYRGGLNGGVDYKRGDRFGAVDDLGRPVYSLTITPEGWLNFARFDGVACTLVRIGHGFDAGVQVSCPVFPPVSVRVEDDLQQGEIREWIDGKPVAIFRYDSDSGMLLASLKL